MVHIIGQKTKEEQHMEAVAELAKLIKYQEKTMERMLEHNSIMRAKLEELEVDVEELLSLPPSKD
jgi:hypothetical protein